MKTVNDYNFKGKKALVRVDFNVPLGADFTVSDTTRIMAAQPTIDKILKDGGSVVLVSHLGRPDGQKNLDYSLRPIVAVVEDVLGVPVTFVEDSRGEKVQNAIQHLQEGEVLLLENLRFYPEEEEGDEDFAKELVQNIDVFVNDAFGTAHRSHASTAVVAKYSKEKMFGLLMAKELDAIDKVLRNGVKPVTAIIGGAKVSSKITIIESMLNAVDNLIIGGGMAYTFIKALGGTIGDSLCEDDKMETALSILEAAKQKNIQVYLPIDTVVANEFSNEAATQIVPTSEIPNGWMGMDIGPQSISLFSDVIQHSKTILWNGPLGVFEMPNFANGTQKIGDAIALATSQGAFSLVGGGDSVAFVKQYGYDDKVSYVSTGGGAMLESLEGKVLPGVAALL